MRNAGKLHKVSLCKRSGGRDLVYTADRGASRKCQFQGRGLESEGFNCVENPVENVYNLLYYEVIVKFM